MLPTLWNDFSEEKTAGSSPSLQMNYFGCVKELGGANPPTSVMIEEIEYCHECTWSMIYDYFPGNNGLMLVARCSHCGYLWKVANYGGS